MFCYNKLAPICSPVHSSLLAKLQVLKDGDEGQRMRLLKDDSTLSPVQNSVQTSVHSPVQSPESRVQVLHQPKGLKIISVLTVGVLRLNIVARSSQINKPWLVPVLGFSIRRMQGWRYNMQQCPELLHKMLQMISKVDCSSLNV